MVATTYKVRSAEAGDHEAVTALWEDAGFGRTAPDEWGALLRGDTSTVLVADREGEVIGAGVATFDGWRAYVYHVAVSPSQRRVGVGGELIREAERYLVAAGARYVYVMVHEENTDGLALVASTGYLPEGDVVLTKRLASRV